MEIIGIFISLSIPILGVFFIVFLIEWVGMQLDKNKIDKEMLELGYNMFANENLRNISIEEQIELYNEAWEENGFGDSICDRVGTLGIYAYNKLLEYIRNGYFTTRK